MRTSLSKERISRISVNFFRTLESFGFKAECIEGDGLSMDKPYTVRLAFPDDGCDFPKVEKMAWKLTTVGFIFHIERSPYFDAILDRIVNPHSAIVVRHPGNVPSIYGVRYEVVQHPLANEDQKATEVIQRLKLLATQDKVCNISFDVVDWSGAVAQTTFVLRKDKLFMKKGARNPIALDTLVPTYQMPHLLRIAERQS